MFYHVKIVQRLVGWAVIEGDSTEHARNNADKLYNEDGNELPEMEDLDSLEIDEAVPIPDKCADCDRVDWCDCDEGVVDCIRGNDNDCEV